MVRRSRSAAAFGVIAVLALAATGCTTGGDGGDSLLSDDGGEAAAVIASAVEHARAGSGRFESTMSATMDYGGGPETANVTITGSFAGDSSSSTWEMRADEEDGAELYRSTKLAVDGRIYVSTERLRDMEGFVGATDDDALIAVTEGDEFQGYRPAEDVDPYSAWDFRALDGKEWVDVSELDTTGNDDADPMAISSVAGMFADPFSILDVVTDVVETEPGEVDGVRTRHFTMAVPPDQVAHHLLGEEYVGSLRSNVVADSDREWAERQAAVDRYAEDHTSVTADLHLDAQGQLLRVTVDAATEIEDRYADCWAITAPFDTLTFTTDFTDMGGDVGIEAPDPATVLSADGFRAAFPEVSGPGEYEYEYVEEPNPIETVDGPRERAAVINDLSKYGYVIGLVPDPWISDPDRTRLPDDHAYSATVAGLGDDDLAAAYAEADAVLSAMARTPTSLGEMTRPELLWNVKVGMRNLGVDLTIADGMSDAQLGELIDGYVVDNGWIVGDGVWGDMPQELIDQFHAQEPTDELSSDEGSSIEDEFAGCPA